MKKDLHEIAGTIAHELVLNKDLIFGENNESKRKQIVLNILNSENLKNNSKVEEAKSIIKNSFGSKFDSVLITYMTGEKV